MDILVSILKILEEYTNGVSLLSALLAGTAATFSALIAVFTVREIKKQRESQYIPDLYIEKSEVILSKPFFGDGYRFFFFSQRENIERGIIDFQLLNFGFGVAKEINFEWKIDYNNIFNEVRNVDKENKLDIKHGATAYDYCIELSDPIFSHLYFKDDLDIRGTINYILPNSSESLEYISIPSLYSDMLGMYLLLKYELDKPVINSTLISEDFIKFPPIILKVNYKDLRRKEYKKSFIFSFKLDWNISAILGSENKLEDLENLGKLKMIINEV